MAPTERGDQHLSQHVVFVNFSTMLDVGLFEANKPAQRPVSARH